MSIADSPVAAASALLETAPVIFGFPQPFTSFERLMLLDDRADYPMTIHVELGFTGRLKKAIFLAALELTIARDPLLHARMAWRGRWPYWIGRAEHSPTVSWQEAEPPEYPQRPPRLDLVRGPGLAVHVYEGGDKTSASFLFHHCCCDGQGARRFLFDLVSAYDRLAPGELSSRAGAVDTLLAERLATQRIPGRSDSRSSGRRRHHRLAADETRSPISPRALCNWRVHKQASCTRRPHPQRHVRSR